MEKYTEKNFRNRKEEKQEFGKPNLHYISCLYNAITEYYSDSDLLIMEVVKYFKLGQIHIKYYEIHVIYDIK